MNWKPVLGIAPLALFVIARLATPKIAPTRRPPPEVTS